MERFDFNFAPYHVLMANERAILQKSVQIVFFDDNTTIIEAGQKAQYLYVVIKGVIKEIGTDGEVVALYHAKDSFEARGLFEDSSHHSFVVAEQSLLYAIEKSVVLSLVQTNVRFGAYFYTSIADRLASLSGAQDEQRLTNLFYAKVYEAYHNNSVWVSGETTLSQTANIMRQNKIKSVLVRYQQKVGILTESVFRDMVASNIDGQLPIYQQANFALIEIEVEDFLFNALLKMMHHRIQRLVVTQAGRAVGLLEQSDILAYLSNHSHLIAEQLERADSLGALSEIAKRLTDSIGALHASGMQAVQLAKLMQVLNTRLFEKAWGMIAPKSMIEKTCLLVMGSEGRGEQVLKTDQDNAIIAHNDVDMVELHTYAVRFSQVLAEFGYPPCKGGVMASNPKWCQPIDQFKQCVANWCKNPTPEAMMELAIFVDAKAVVGDESLLDELKGYLYAYLDQDVGMQMAFARAMLQFDDHSRGFFAKMLGKTSPEHMDIKKMGLFPVVHGIKSLSIKAGIVQTNSFERLSALHSLGVINDQLAKDVGEALAYLMNLRLKSGLFAFRNNQALIPNQVDTQLLSTLERDLLKDALQVVKRFKHEVKSQFGLGNV